MNSRIFENTSLFFTTFFITPLETLVDRPLFFFGIAVFLFNRNWGSLAFLSITYIGSSFWWNYIISQNNIKIFNDLIEGYLIRFAHCDFVCYPFEEVFDKEALTYFQARRPSRFFSWKSSSPLGYIYTVKRKKNDEGKIYPASYTTFPFVLSPSYIMMRDDPKDMKPYQQFCLYHELGHISSIQAEGQERVLLNQSQAALLVIVIAVLSQGDVIAVFCSAIIYLLWTSIGQEATKRNQSYYEAYADAYAIFMMAKRPDFQDISRLFTDSLNHPPFNQDEEDLDNRLTLFNRASEWALNPINPEDRIISRILSRTLAAISQINDFSNPKFISTMNYFGMLGNQWKPNTNSYLVIGGLILICALHTTNLGGWTLAAITLPIVVLPLIAFFIGLVLEARAEQQIKEQLGENKVDEQVDNSTPNTSETNANSVTP